MKRLVLLGTALLFLLLPSAAFAYDPLQGPGGACKANSATDSSAACTPVEADPVNSTLKKASLIIATIAGVAAVIIIIIGGFQFITSGGDAQKVAGARNAIVGAAIGLVIIAGAETIILFVVSKL